MEYESFYTLYIVILTSLSQKCSLINKISYKWFLLNWMCHWCGVKHTIQVEGTSAAPSAGLIRHRAAVYLFLVPLLLFLFSPATQAARSGRHQGDRLCGLCLRTLSRKKEEASDPFIELYHDLQVRFNIWYHRSVDSFFWPRNQPQSEN